MTTISPAATLPQIQQTAAPKEPKESQKAAPAPKEAAAPEDAVKVDIRGAKERDTTIDSEMKNLASGLANKIARNPEQAVAAQEPSSTAVQDLLA